MAMMMEHSPLKASPPPHFMPQVQGGRALEPLYGADDMMMESEEGNAMVDDDGDTEYSLARPPTPTMVHRQSTPLSPPFTMHGRDSWRQGTPSESPFPTPAQPQWGGNGSRNSRASFPPGSRPPPTPYKESRSSFGSDQGSVGSNYSRFREDFEVVKELGKGSFGEVYHVRSRVDGMEYAIKCTQRQFRGEADRDRYLREVKALAKLCNSDSEEVMHIVRYHQAWIEDKRLYMQTELCDASLDVWVAQGNSLDFEEYFDFLRQMLMALDIIHSNGLVHLDIKPGNIFLKAGHYKLGDFGLVTCIGNGGVGQYEEEGDTRYMSADLLLPGPKDLTKCDLFSLGITVYELILGRPLPPNGPEWTAIRQGQLGVPENELTMLLALLMAPDPASRPPARELLTHHPRLRSKIERELSEERRRSEAYRGELLKKSSRKLKKTFTWG